MPRVFRGETTMLMVDYRGRLLVPRLRPISKLNDRYNSAFRTVQNEVHIRESVVELHHIPGGDQGPESCLLL